MKKFLIIQNISHLILNRSFFNEKDKSFEELNAFFGKMPQVFQLQAELANGTLQTIIKKYCLQEISLTKIKNLFLTKAVEINGILQMNPDVCIFETKSIVQRFYVLKIGKNFWTFQII